MTFAELAAWYKKKTGFIVPEIEGYKLEYYPEHGFCQWRIAEMDGIKAVGVAHTATHDVFWWIKLLTYYGWCSGAEWLHTQTPRNPEAYCKLTGTTRFPRTDETMPDGRKLYGVIRYIGKPPQEFHAKEAS